MKLIGFWLGLEPLLFTRSKVTIQDGIAVHYRLSFIILKAVSTICHRVFLTQTLYYHQDL